MDRSAHYGESVDDSSSTTSSAVVVVWKEEKRGNMSQACQMQCGLSHKKSEDRKGTKVLGNHK